MARWSKRRRTPIKRTKQYKKGQMQAALITFLAVAVFIEQGLVQQSITFVQGLVKKVGG